MPPSLFTWKDLFRSIIIGVLFGWLLISIHDPAHKRFKFDLAQGREASPETNRSIL